MGWRGVLAEADAKKRSCFVVAPIGSAGSPERSHSDWVLEYIIHPAFAGHADFNVERSDQIDEPGMIDAQIINRLFNADLVIVDMSFLNPNVFYEIGIRHTVFKPIIHMFLEGTPLPFDVSPFRAISFKLAHPNDIRSAVALLASALKEALADGHTVDNPVTKARGYEQFREQATEPIKVLMDDMQSLKAQLHEVQNRLRAETSWPHARSSIGQISLSFSRESETASEVTIELKPGLSARKRNELREAFESLVSANGFIILTRSISADVLQYSFPHDSSRIPILRQLCANFNIFDGVEAVLYP